MKDKSKAEALAMSGEAGEDERTATSVAAKTLCVPFAQPKVRPSFLVGSTMPRASPRTPPMCVRVTHASAVAATCRFCATHIPAYMTVCVCTPY